MVTFASGFILPKLYLLYFGSEVNGLVSSITQYLGFITLAECGVGAVTQSALYRPLANNDYCQINKIIVASDRFFKKIGIILLGYVLFLVIIYPRFINDSFDWIFTASLIIAISISTFAQYYFSMTYRLLLSADQLGYIQMSLQIITIIINTIFNVILTKNGFSIAFVKLSTSIVFLIQPIGLHCFVNHHYSINKKIDDIGNPISQKWNGLAQHISAVILSRTDIAILSFFSLSSVSVYNVYFMVVYGIKTLFEVLTSAIQSYVANIYAKNETALLTKAFSMWEWLSHISVTLLFACTGILLVPFAKVYTIGVDDCNYIVPFFSAIITIAYAVFSLRYPYTAMIKIAGHYKETQLSCVLEAAINISLSIILVIFWGLPGVAIATLVSVLYRTIYCVCYLQKNILFRSFFLYVKNCIIDAIAVMFCLMCTRHIHMKELTWNSWIFTSMIVFLICALIILIVNVVFYYKNVKACVKYIASLIRKR